MKKSLKKQRRLDKFLMVLHSVCSVIITLKKFKLVIKE